MHWLIGLEVWAIVMEKANNPIYDNKHCYDNGIDCVGNKLHNLKKRDGKIRDVYKSKNIDSIYTEIIIFSFITRRAA